MTLLDKTNTLVVIPAFNEENSIVSVIEEIKATGFPFVVIDDGSIDETRNRAISAGARTISLPFNAGVGGALKCGFQFAVKNGYKSVIQFDADGQHPSDQISNLVEHANITNSAMVIGSRFLENTGQVEVSYARKITMKYLSFVASRHSDENISDTTSGFRLIAAPLLNQFAESFPDYYLGDTFESIIFSLDESYRVSEIGISIRKRANGTSTASAVQATKNVVKVLLIALMGFHFNFIEQRRETTIQKIKRRWISPDKKTDFFTYLFLYFTPYLILLHLRFNRYQFRTIAGDDAYYLGLSQKPGGFGSSFWNSGFEEYFGKWRPITQMPISVLLDLFSGEFWKYKLLNEILLAIVGTLVASLVARIHPLGKSISWFAGSFVVLTRFNLFNVLQLLGVMENIALICCLLTLNFIVRYVKSGTRRDYLLVNTFFFAAIHSHERYLFLFPVVLLAVTIFPETKRYKDKVLRVILPCLIVGFNFAVKTYLLKVDFLTGGAAVPINGSLSNIAWFSWRGLLNIFGFNSGPDYLSGKNAHALGPTAIWIAAIWMVPCVSVLIGALVKLLRKSNFRRAMKMTSVPVVTICCLLLSASITFRQEYRWLFSPFLIFVVMVFCSIGYLIRNGIARIGVSLLLIAAGTINGLYYARYAENTYFFMTQKLTDSIYEEILVKHESELDQATFIIIDHGAQVFDWAIGGGLYFDIYSKSDEIDIRRIKDIGDLQSLNDLRSPTYLFDYQWDQIVSVAS